MKSLYRHIKQHTLVYVTRDIERALGIPPKDGYFIITNRTPYSETIQEKHKDNIWLVDTKNNELYDTQELLLLPEVKKTLNDINPFVVVFKNTPLIEKTCKENNWRLLNPSALLAEQIEHKISQTEWLGESATFLPEFSVHECKRLVWDNEPFIIQFNRSHTGEGTIYINSEDTLADIQEKFPSRLVKKSKFIQGPMYTSNVVVGATSILAGNISCQITGQKPFTEAAFATVGNDWELPHKTLSGDMLANYNKIAEQVAVRMQQSGWKGLFGIDVKVEPKTGKVYLIEINARQPASASYESHLQSVEVKNGVDGITIFEAHLAALFGFPVADPIVPLQTGSQIIQRVTTPYLNGSKKIKAETISALTKRGLRAVNYPNLKPNADLLRIQAEHGVMATPDTLNTLGQTIVTLLNS